MKRIWGFAIGLLFSASCFSQTYPAKPLRIVVPFAPGGSTDIFARLVAEKLSAAFAQPVVVENRAGASGNIGAEAVARSAPDGYTVLMATTGVMAINNALFKSMSYDAAKDLEPVVFIASITNVLAVPLDLPAKNLAELIALAKKEPGKINFASVGLGSYPHLDMERFMKASGTEMTHVPYKGGAGQAIPAIIAGEVQLAFFNMASLLPHIRSGRLKALAAVPAQRLPELPNVPTLAEQGFPGIGTNAWQGLFAPAATPGPVVDKIYTAVAAVLAREKTGLAEKMMTVDVSPSPAAFTAQVRRETQAWGEFLRDAKIKIE
jgi:tripartite-type tricarboxylate transporter receptor subunit TctC